MHMQDTICGCRKLSMLSISDFSELTKTRSPKAGDAARKVECDSLEDSYISCLPKFVFDILSRERAKSYPDAFDCTHVILKSFC